MSERIKDRWKAVYEWLFGGAIVSLIIYSMCDCVMLIVSRDIFHGENAFSVRVQESQKLITTVGNNEDFAARILVKNTNKKHISAKVIDSAVG